MVFHSQSSVGDKPMTWQKLKKKKKNTRSWWRVTFLLKPILYRPGIFERDFLICHLIAFNVAVAFKVWKFNKQLKTVLATATDITHLYSGLWGVLSLFIIIYNSFMFFLNIYIYLHSILTLVEHLKNWAFIEHISTSKCNNIYVTRKSIARTTNLQP